MLRVLYLDLATLSGYAAGTVAGVEGWGTFEMPRKTGDVVGKFLNVADAHIERLVKKFKPTMIAAEAPWMNSRRDVVMTIRKLGGLVNVAEQVADRHGLECREARVDDVRNHFLGKGYPRERESAKIAAKVKCRDLGLDVDTDDEAEALAGLFYMLAVENPGVAILTTPLFQQKPKRIRSRAA